MSRKKITFAVGESGHPIGEGHHKAKLTDADVELIRDIYEEGLVSYSTLASVFGVDKATIRDIVKYRRRASTLARFVTVDADKRKRPLPRSRLAQLGVDENAVESSADWDNDH